MAPKTPEKVKQVAAEDMEMGRPANQQQDKSISQLLTRLSQQFNLLLLLFVALFLFQAYSFYKLKALETKGVAPQGAAQNESPLTPDKLVSYAKDLGLDEDAFKKCLDSGEMAKKVTAESQEGAGLKVQGTPGFFVNGRFLGGAFPYEMFKEIIDKELAGTGSDTCTDYSEGLQQYCKDPANAPFNPVAQKVAIGDSPVRGSKSAKVTIVEFSDFECPFCHRAFGTVQQIEKAYPKDVRLVYKQLPLTSIHPHAQKAAEASLCAKAQGKFWEFHDKVFKLQAGG